MTTVVAIVVFVFFGASQSFAGVLVGNGGDSIFCQKTGESGRFKHSGFYVLDYAVNFPDDLSKLAKVESLTQSLNRIEKLVRSRAPEALPSFLSFRAAWMPRPFVETDERIWNPAQRRLTDIKDEWARQLPWNCRFNKSKEKLYGIYQQTVVRRRLASGKVSYQYDSAIVGDYLSQVDPTQASVLFIHEWLWDFYEGDRVGAPRIRNANLFLHSQEAEKASAGEFIQKVFRAQR